MTYTPEQLREWARFPGSIEIGEQLRAHAAALEENARLNKWADGMTDAALKERKTAEEYQRELREENARLRAELAKLRAEANDDDALRERMADILTRTAAALKGEPEPLTLHDWSGLPEIAELALTAERERADRNQEDAERLCSLLDATEVNGDRFTWKRRALLPTEALRDEIDAIFGLDAARRK